MKWHGIRQKKNHINVKKRTSSDSQLKKNCTNHLKLKINATTIALLKILLMVFYIG